MLVHEDTYHQHNLLGYFHRNRLKHIIALVERVGTQPEGSLGDFGCSNGFIIERLQQELFAGRRWSFVGFDRRPELLALAKDKNIGNARFELVDLNQGSSIAEGFDVVTCFETLEHVGNYRAAVETLVSACKPGGYIVICVPNQKRLAGILQYLGLRFIRRESYARFFAEQSELQYIIRLVWNMRIDGFRSEDAPSWDPHLGFDNDVFERFLLDRSARPDGYTVIIKKGSLLKMNLFYVLRKS